MNGYHWPLAMMFSLVFGLFSFHGPGLGVPSAQALSSSHPPLVHQVRAASTSPVDSTSASLREALLAKGVLTLLQTHHLRQRPLDDQTSEMVFDLFLSQLDPQKLYLTLAEVNSLRQYALLLDDQLRQGQLDFAHHAGALRRQRAALVAIWVEALLANPFDFTRQESLELDGEKRAFSKDDAELRERWRRVLKRGVLAFTENIDDGQEDEAGVKPAPPEAPAAALKTAAELEAKARQTLAKRYQARFDRVSKEDWDDDLDRFINAFVGVYDPHTAYLPPYRKEDFDIRVSGSLEGIGAVLSQDTGYVKVQSIVTGSASWRQGQLKAEDIILAVAQDGEEPVDVVDARLRDVVQLIRGKKGTIVKLTVRKPKGEVVVIPIIRDVVRLEDVYAKSAMLELAGVEGRFAYIDLPKFYGRVSGHEGTMTPRHASLDIYNALGQLQKRHVRGLILDLRGNSGGLLHEAIRVSGLFITTGPIVQTRAADGSHQVLRDRDKTMAFGGPLVVLVDRFSASASEILAAALQDYGRAVVVGNTTHGKGTVQQLHSLDEIIASTKILPPHTPRLGALKLTRYQFYRINGDSTQIRGVSPDIPLPDTAAHLEIGEGDKEYAIPWNAIDPATHISWSRRWDVIPLRHKSLARQAQNDAFIKDKARMALMQKRREETMEVLEKDAWLQGRKQEAADIEAVKIAETERFKVEPVEYQPDDNTPVEARVALAAEWSKTLQGDPWVEEAIRILDDIAAGELLLLK